MYDLRLCFRICKKPVSHDKAQIICVSIGDTHAVVEVTWCRQLGRAAPSRLVKRNLINRMSTE